MTVYRYDLGTIDGSTQENGRDIVMAILALAERVEAVAERLAEIQEHGLPNRPPYQRATR